MSIDRRVDTAVVCPTKEVDTLPDDEQQALVLVIDSMVKRTKINLMAASSPRKRASSGVLASH